MKFSAPSYRTDCRYSRGFSMIELMTVVGIMILLAGLLLAALPGIQNKVNRNRVERLMAELENGLNSYQIDNGIYPQNAPGGSSQSERDSTGIEGAEVLYKELSGDRNQDGEVDMENNEKVYVPKLSYDENKDSKDPRATLINGRYFVVDPYGDPFRYLAQPPNIDQDERQTFNPTYDLWSIAGSDPTTPEKQAAHITNWQAN